MSILFILILICDITEGLSKNNMESSIFTHNMQVFHSLHTSDLDLLNH